jgi:hypothetical protein
VTTPKCNITGADYVGRMKRGWGMKTAIKLSKPSLYHRWLRVKNVKREIVKDFWIGMFISCCQSIETGLSFRIVGEAGVDAKCSTTWEGMANGE